MLRFFYPDVYAESVFDVDYDGLKTNGIVNLLFDIDNTLAPVVSPDPDAGVIELFGKLTDAGFNICLLSNGGPGRAERFAEPLGVPFVAKAKKPAAAGLKKVLLILPADHTKTAIIGDQLFTDILCGKRNKIYSILVRQISEDEQWYIKIKRVLETPVLACFRKKRRMDDKKPRGADKRGG